MERGGRRNSRQGTRALSTMPMRQGAFEAVHVFSHSATVSQHTHITACHTMSHQQQLLLVVRPTADTSAVMKAALTRHPE